MITPLVRMTLSETSNSEEVWTITVVVQKDDIMYDVEYIQDEFWISEVTNLRLMVIHATASNFGNIHWGVDLLKKVAKHTPTASNSKSKIQDRDQYVTISQAVEILSRWWVVHAL